MKPRLSFEWIIDKSTTHRCFVVNLRIPTGSIYLLSTIVIHSLFGIYSFVTLYVTFLLWHHFISMLISTRVTESLNPGTMSPAADGRRTRCCYCYWLDGSLTVGTHVLTNPDNLPLQIHKFAVPPGGALLYTCEFVLGKWATIIISKSSSSSFCHFSGFVFRGSFWLMAISWWVVCLLSPRFSS